MASAAADQVANTDSWERFAEQLAAIVRSVQQVVVASESTVKLGLLGLFSEGHVLLEDLPGVGKTLLAKTLAQSIDAKFTRIQFTPDLLPTDITGTSVFDLQSKRFEFIAGPIFANIVLADEINRAGPRTQSALLEAMGERQVTADGDVHDLPRPFLVIATQNLAESHGTFPLPNSQLDRFAISMRMGFPTREQELDILHRSENGTPAASHIMSSEDVVWMQDHVRQVQVAASVREYMLNILDGTRQHAAVALGASPRGGTFLQRAAQTWASFEGRSFVVPEDVKEVARPVLTHRLIMNAGRQTTAEQVLVEVLDSVAVPV